MCIRDRLIIAYGKVLPIIATMGFMYIYRGLAYVISNSEWASAENLGTFKAFALGKVAGLNNVIWVMIIIYVIFFIVMKWTKVGRKVYAVGSNREAAAISGINTKRIDVMEMCIRDRACDDTVKFQISDGAMDLEYLIDSFLDERGGLNRGGLLLADGVGDNHAIHTGIKENAQYQHGKDNQHKMGDCQF